jgi:tRNA modification GTPase
MTGSTIAAIATPAGRGGVSIIRISGPGARQAALCIAQPEFKLVPRRALLCGWHDAAGEVLDSGILLYFPAPHSYTGEDVVELQGHGSPVLMRALLERLFDLGCRPAEPGEFTRRAVENSKMDLSQAEAVAACIDAATLRAGKQAQRQLSGEFGRHIEGLMQRLTGLVAHVEAALDFPEEDIPDLYFSRLKEDIEVQVIGPVRRLLASAPLGERLFDGATVAIIGAPNVGKSSLLNVLAGRDRAIVSDVPGTTRDVLEVDFEVHGIPVRLADTAGLRSSEDSIEQEGVRRAVQAAEQADAVILVSDATRPETWNEHKHADLYLMNKMDLATQEIPRRYLPISVKSEQGIDVLRDHLATRLGDIDLSEEAVLVTRERHRQALQEALELIEKGLHMLGREDELDLVALDWRRAWSSLGSILGIGDVEYILDRIFTEFCIGK